MRVVVAGTRTFRNYELLRSTLDNHLALITPDEEVVIVSGCNGGVDATGPYGADFLGECYAKARKLQVRQFPAHWETHGKSAGPIRNREMLSFATDVVCFWDGKSRGTGDMISIALEAGKRLLVVPF